jgi:hypothetical protein
LDEIVPWVVKEYGMKTKIAITVDTEPSIAGAFADPKNSKPRIHEPVWGEVGGKSQALGYILETLSCFQLSATFFVETVHLSYFSDQIMGEYVQKICAAGQDIQLHLHPCWLNFEQELKRGDTPISDQCSELTDDQLVSLITTGRRRICDWTGTTPCSLRTGNFSASESVYRAMKTTGLPVASNICVAVAPPLEASSDQWGDAMSLAGGVHRLQGITELPVTCFRDRGPVGRGRLRPLQITACSFEEHRMQLIDLHRAGASVAVIVTHPFEFLQWSGVGFSRLRANRLVQRRFKRLCAFLAENTDRFEVVPIGRLADDGLSAEPAIALDGNPFFATRRAVENFTNDRWPLGKTH